MEEQATSGYVQVQDAPPTSQIGTPQLVPVGSIFFQNGNTTMQLDVKDDITSRESAHLSVLLTQAMISLMSGGRIDSDWYSYIMEKELERHFIPGVLPSAEVVAEDS